MLSAVALLAMSVGVFAQGTPVLRRESPPTPPIGDWRTVDAGGGFKFEYFFAWKPFEYESPDHTVFPWDICSFQCREKKHEKHADCDFSCDEQCETEHIRLIRPTWESNLSNLYDWLSRTFRSFNNTKIPWSFQWRGTGTVEAIHADFQQAVIDPATMGDYMSNATVAFEGTHQKEACGRARFRYRMGRASLVMKYRLSDSSGVFGEGEYAPAGYLYAALPGVPREELEYGSGPCLCKPGETQTSHLFVPSGNGFQPPGVWIDEGNTGKYILATAVLIERHGIRIACPNMSQFEVSAEHPTMPITVLVTPGAVLRPLDPAYQQVLLCSRLVAQFAPHQNLFAFTGPRFGFKAPTGVAACLNLDKQMPTRATQYKIGIPADGRLVHLGRIGAEQPSFGPWDQARTWIYTDGATLPKVNEKLLLGVTPTQYVGELYNLEKKAGVDLSAPKYRPCLTPDLLVGKSGPAAAIGWFSSKIAALDPKGTADLLAKRHSEFADLLSGLEVARQRLHTIALFNGLLSSKDPGVQLAALKLLNEHADAAELKVLMSNRGLMWAGRLLRSSDPAVAQEALTLFERLEHPYALAFLPKAAAAKPELKARVTTLISKLEAVAKT